MRLAAHLVGRTQGVGQYRACRPAGREAPRRARWVCAGVPVQPACTPFPREHVNEHP